MKITIKDYGELELLAGETLMAALVRHHMPLQNVCNGKGTCGKCKVRITEGLTEPNAVDLIHLSPAERERGIRLACRLIPPHPMAVELTFGITYDRKNRVIQEDFDHVLNSGLEKLTMDIPRPSLADERGDWDRVEQELQLKLNRSNPLDPAFRVLEKLPRVLREGDFTLTSTLFEDRVLDCRSGVDNDPLYGIAIDIGTTSVALALLDLSTGQIIKVVSAENGQTAYGGDVISRISYANEGIENRRQLKEAITGTINDLLKELYSATGITADSVFKMTIVANTTMNHLFLGLDVSNLAVSPYVSANNQVFQGSAEQLGLKINPEGIVQLLPNIGSFVGGDTVGAVLASRSLFAPGNHLLIDLGTNCELFLKTNTTMLSCSTAAGPAFEGAGMAYGMRAKPGAIEGVKIYEESMEVKVIGDQAAIGICGSGLIEAIEQMRKAGIISKKGALVNPEQAESLSPVLRERIRFGEKREREFILAFGKEGEPDITLSQKDIVELQLAKGAVCAGIHTLLDLAGIHMADLDSIVFAGTFASYLTKDSVLNIGLLPNIDPEKIKMAGNAAHAGAIQALVDKNELERADALARKIKHVELGGSKLFTGYLMKSMAIAPTHD